MDIQKPKLLIVDDQPNNIHALKRLIGSDELEIIEAHSGMDALKIVLQHDFFLILMDVQMPGMSGFEAAELILNHKATAHIPVIFVTAISKSENYMLQGYGSGAVDYIYKPIDPQILSGKVRIFRDLWQAKARLKGTNAQLQQQQQELLLQTRALESANAKINVLLNAAGEGVLGVDSHGQIGFANPKACQLLGCEAGGGLIGLNVGEFFDRCLDEGALEPECVETQLARMLNSDNRNSTERIYWRRLSGERFCVEYSCNQFNDETAPSSDNGGGGASHEDGVSHEEAGAVILFQDVTLRKEMEDRLVRMANYDALTNLANRSFFHAELHKAMERQKRSANMLTVLFIDLDNFKAVNDSWGHDVGDQLLQQVAERISRVVREGDMVARLGGDEFAVILYDINNPDNAGPIADKILQQLAKPFELGQHQAQISGSIGIAPFDGSDIDQDELLRHADKAMYSAKNGGKNGWVVF